LQRNNLGEIIETEGLSKLGSIDIRENMVEGNEVDFPQYNLEPVVPNKDLSAERAKDSSQDKLEDLTLPKVTKSEEPQETKYSQGERKKVREQVGKLLREIRGRSKVGLTFKNLRLPQTRQIFVQYDL